MSNESFMITQVLQGPMPLQTRYFYKDIETEFSSHHGKFMLEKAVMLLQHKSWVEGVDDAMARGQSIDVDTKSERDACEKKISIAKQQWWYDEAEYLVDSHLYDVLEFAEVVRRTHASCGPTRTCSHTAWHSTGSPTQRTRFRHT
jgi:hypothetical protein